MTIKCENEIVDIFCKKNKKKKLYREVPVCMRSVDLVEYDKKKNEITAIEFKVSDWKTAIKQLVKVSFCFDKLILCINEPKREESLRKIVNECNKYGIGLYLLKKDNSFDHNIIEKVNENIWNSIKCSIVKYIESI